MRPPSFRFGSSIEPASPACLTSQRLDARLDALKPAPLLVPSNLSNLSNLI
jgi:hypothetical protein